MIYEDANKLDKIIIPILKGPQPDPIYPNDDIIEVGIKEALLSNNIQFPQNSVDSSVSQLINEHPEFVNKPSLRQLGRNYLIGDNTTWNDEITFEVATTPIYWNQLAEYDNSEYISFGITVTPIDTGGLHIYGRCNSRYGVDIRLLNPEAIPLTGKTDHVFFIGTLPFDNDFTVISGVYFYYYIAGYRTPYEEHLIDLTTATIFKYNGGDDGEMGMELRLDSGYDFDFNFYPQIFDLTEMFGSEYADYIYSLEIETGPLGGEDAPGVSLFRQIFPKIYYPYNSGEFRWASVPGSYPVDGSIVAVDFPYNVHVEDGNFLNIADAGSYPIKFPFEKPYLKYPVYADSNNGHTQTLMFYNDSYHLLHLDNKFSANILNDDANKNARILPSSMPDYQIFHTIRKFDFMTSEIPAYTLRTLTSEWFPISNITKTYEDGEGYEYLLTGFIPLIISYWQVRQNSGASEKYVVFSNRVVMNEDNSAYAIEIVFYNYSNRSTTVVFDLDVLGYFSEMSDDNWAWG